MPLGCVASAAMTEFRSLELWTSLLFASVRVRSIREGEVEEPREASASAQVEREVVAWKVRRTRLYYFSR
jgi:hypothetical protein